LREILGLECHMISSSDVDPDPFGSVEYKIPDKINWKAEFNKTKKSFFSQEIIFFKSEP